MTKDEAIKKVLDLARSEVGYHEKASNSQLNDKTANSGGANWTKYAEYLDSFAGFYNGPKNSFPWCDVFYDFLFVKTFGLDIGRQMLCQPLNSMGAGCLYSAQYYKEAGRWHKNAPNPGDQIFFSYSAGEYSHTGIVDAVGFDTITTIEGNTSDSVGRRSYNIGNPMIAGYGTPKWDLAESIPDSDDSQAEPVKPEKALQPPTVQYGSVGNAVCLLQSALNERGYDCGDVDGEFGDLTEGALVLFQEDFSLNADGIAGPLTWPELLYCKFN